MRRMKCATCMNESRSVALAQKLQGRNQAVQCREPTTKVEDTLARRLRLHLRLPPHSEAAALVAVADGLGAPRRHPPEGRLKPDPVQAAAAGARQLGLPRVGEEVVIEAAGDDQAGLQAGVFRRAGRQVARLQGWWAQVGERSGG